MSGHSEDKGAGEGGEHPLVETGEPKPRWPRRRLLRWALGMVPIAAGGGWAAFEWLSGRWSGPKMESDEEAWANSFTQGVAMACFTSHPHLGSGLEGLLQSPRPSRPARLLGACWALETGNWNRVRWHLAAPGIRDTTEARLLLALAERQPRAPNWCQTFLDTWQALGRPDFRKSTILPQPLGMNLVLADIGALWETATEAQRFALVPLHLSEVAPHQEWILEQVRATSSVPLLMALREQLLAIGAEVPVHQRLLPPVEERLGQLAEPSPRTLQLALVPFLPASAFDTPFERRDLETLEKLVALPVWKQPSSETFFLELRTLFDGLLLAPGHHALLMASSAQSESLGLWLMRRAKASKAHLNGNDQQWLGKLLWEVGARLREQGSNLEMDMGLKLQVFGSELTGHSSTREESIGAWVELGQWEDALKQCAFYRWPLASLQEESCAPRARDERLWMKAFAGRGELR